MEPVNEKEQMLRLLFSGTVAEAASLRSAFEEEGIPCSIDVVSREEAALKLLRDGPVFDAVVVTTRLTGCLRLCRAIVRYRMPLFLLFHKGDEQIAAAGLKAGVEYLLHSDPQGCYLKFLPSYIATMACPDRNSPLRNVRSLPHRGAAQRHKVILETAGTGIVFIGRNGAIAFANATAAAILGYERDELLGKDCHCLIHHTTSIGTDYPPNDCPVYAAFREQRPYCVTGDVFWHKGGKPLTVEYVSSPLWEDGAVSGTVIVFSDISHRLQAETARRESRQHLSQIVKGSPVPTFVINRDHIVTEWNRGCEKITGINAEDMTGTSCQWRAFYTEERPVLADLIVDEVPEETIAHYYGEKARRSSLVDGAYEVEDYFPGSGRWLFFTAAPLYGADGRITGAVETLQDMTERKRAEASLAESERRYRELSITDNLTGLYNSRHFYTQLQQEIIRAERYRLPLSLLLLDVDDFKSYNDTFGHLEGDKVLMMLAGIIRLFLRSTDSAYRFGGEEFTILLPQTDLSEARVVADRLRRAFAETTFFPLPDIKTRVTVSIGVGQYRCGEDQTDLIRRTDKGTYQAKKLGKNCVACEE